MKINDEYLCAVRTKSFADFFFKAQLLVSSTPTPCHPALSEILLNPGQQTIESLLESSKSSCLKPLLLNYFNISAEASTVCSHLLTSLTQLQLQSNDTYIDAVDLDDSSQQLMMISKLRSHLSLHNPFSDLINFKHIQEKHSSVLHQLKSRRKRVARKIKLIKFFNRASDAWVAAGCGVAVRRKIRSFRFLRKVVDVAAKGAYILNRDFDTIGRLVARIQDEIEHNRAMICSFLERREDRHCSQMLKELKKYEFGVSKQAEELEEHVYLCLLTINRARAMVVREICAQNSLQ